MGFSLDRVFVLVLIYMSDLEFRLGSGVWGCDVGGEFVVISGE